MSLAQTPTEVKASIRERGLHHQQVEVVRQVPDENGGLITVTNAYTQLETGLNYRNAQGELEETKAEFELVPGGAIAWKGQHRVSLAGDLNTAEAIQLRLPDGNLVAAHVLGLAYYDSATGDAVMIAAVKDSGGWQVTPNQIVYPDAFAGTEADVRYTFSRSGFEQDIILRERPPSPEKFGFNPATTRLEVWTEFTTAPEPRIKRGGQELSATAESEAADETLDFGSMQIGEGRSFLLGREIELGDAVRKRWLHSTEGRRFLVEAVDLPAVAAEFEALPAAREKGGVSLPPARPTQRQQALNTLPAKTKRAAAQTAMLPLVGRQDLVAAYQRPGLVVDYRFDITASKTDFTFQSDTTYYVTGNYGLSGTTTLEGGAVIKFAQYVAGSVDPRLYVYGPFVSKTSRYRPAVFTAKDDDSVGEMISGSTHDPGSTPYANVGLRFYDAPVAKLEHVRFRNAVQGASFHSSSSNTLAHAQFVNCQYPISNTGAGAAGCYNVLIDRVPTDGLAFYGWSNTATIYGEHMTFHRVHALRANVAVVLKNSLLVQVTNIQSYTGTSCTQLSSDAGVFQSAYAGDHYLAPGSPYRNAGTTALEPTLAAELGSLTTEAPQLLTTALNLDTVLSPRVQRDTDLPDSGYHYAPLDYVLNGVDLSAKLTLNRGVAVATAGSHGLRLLASSQFVSEGLAEQLNALTRYNSVQERALTNDSGGVLSKIDHYYSPRPVVSLRFAEIVACNQAGGVKLVDIGTTNVFDTITLESCQLSNIGLVLWPIDSLAEALTLRNNLFQRCALGFYKDYFSENTPLTVTVRNNLFWRGRLDTTYDYYTGGNNPYWTFKDNLLDGVTNVLNSSTGSSGYVLRSNNAFTSGTTTNQFNGTGDLTLLSADYATGPLGAFYLPASGGGTSLASLRNAGSQTATAAGLYHFATDATQTKESSTQVDIGFHYVATEAYKASAGFSSTQGANGWWYMYGSLQGAAAGYLTNYAAGVWSRWTNGGDQYCLLWSNGGHPGDNYDSIRRFVSPRGGRIWVTGDVTDTQPGCGTDGVSVRVALDGTTLSSWLTLTNGGSGSLTATTWVNPGGNIDFQLNKLTNYGCDGVTWDPVIAYALPRDTDGDGLADYAEDRDGDNSVDAGESDPNTSNNGLTGGSALVVFTPLQP